MNKDINSKMNFLLTEIKKKVFRGVAQSFNNEIKHHFETHPTGVGVTLQHFKEMSVRGDTSQETIAMFDKGYPAWLQEGVSSSVYPYDKKKGTYVSFADEPSLEEWAKKNYKKYKTKMKGLKVGKDGITAFGKKQNLWFTHAMQLMKSNSQTRSNILREIKTIKIK